MQAEYNKFPYKVINLQNLGRKAQPQAHSVD